MSETKVTFPPPIIVTVSGGVVQHVGPVPAGVVVGVRDYDCDGSRPCTKTDEAGDQYECWTATAGLESFDDQRSLATDRRQILITQLWNAIDELPAPESAFAALCELCPDAFNDPGNPNSIRFQYAAAAGLIDAANEAIALNEPV